MSAAEVLLLAGTALHAGFQLVVTGVVYPAFADVPDDRWEAHHGAHGKRIGPVVGVVYGVLLLAAIVVLSEPIAGWTAVALLATGSAFMLTALGAVPAHRALAKGREPAALRKLLVVDRLRLLAAVVAAATAAAAAAV